MKPTANTSLARNPHPNQELAAELKRFPTFAQLRESGVLDERRAALDSLLAEPRVYESAAAQPRLRRFIRVVQWNIERGARLQGFVEALNTHPILRHADILLLNELDIGMARTGNIDVVAALSESLSANAIFTAEYLELEKGTAEERHVAGDNAAALHGNAILSRYPMSSAAVARLPRCENNFESVERRIGGRTILTCLLNINNILVVTATTHLDVVNSPRCRARQMRSALDAIEARSRSASTTSLPRVPVIAGGDLNTHTFSRGGRLNAIKNTVLILGGSRERLSRRLNNPERKEPAIRALRERGYLIDQANDRRSTSRSVVSRLDDSKHLPAPVTWWVKRRVGPEGVLLDFRLDWLAPRGIRVLKEGETTDTATRVTSIAPQTISGLLHNGIPLSDHDPIVVDLSTE